MIPMQPDSGVAKRIGSSVQRSANPRQTESQRPRKAWTLRILGGLFLIPAFIKLAAGNFTDSIGSLLVVASMIGAAELIQRGIANEQTYNRRGVAKAPPPLRAMGACCVAVAAFLASFLMSDDGFAIALLFAGLGGAATVFAYGLDPSGDKLLEEGTERGVSNERVIETIALAEDKLADIASASSGLNSRTVRERISRIIEQAHKVLHQIEKDPDDILRARRFLVTYLDGMRDVVTKYAAQQHDLADTELADNLDRVLGTIEQVFIEQEEILKRDEALDLEVKIEVLESQLKREGVN